MAVGTLQQSGPCFASATATTGGRGVGRVRVWTGRLCRWPFARAISMASRWRPFPMVLTSSSAPIAAVQGALKRTKNYRCCGSKWLHIPGKGGCQARTANPIVPHAQVTLQPPKGLKGKPLASGPCLLSNPRHIDYCGHAHLPTWRLWSGCCSPPYQSISAGDDALNGLAAISSHRLCWLRHWEGD